MVLLLSALSPKVYGAVLFEGYAKVLSGGVHIGYFISRYEFLEKENAFKSTYYLRTNALGGDISESLSATATADKLDPIGYVYTSVAGNKSTIIEAQAKNGKLIAKVFRGEPGKEKDKNKTKDDIPTITRDLPPNAFFSTFLAYRMLKGEKGISSDTKYEYQAVAEEDATVYKGMAYVKELESFKNIEAYKVLNEFKGSKFISYASKKGEMLATKSPLQSIETELVATANEATQGIELNPESLKIVFGDIPRGLENTLSKSKGSKKATVNEEVSKKVPGKKEGVPAGKGITVKGGQ